MLNVRISYQSQIHKNVPGYNLVRFHLVPGRLNGVLRYLYTFLINKETRSPVLRSNKWFTQWNSKWWIHALKLPHHGYSADTSTFVEFISNWWCNWTLWRTLHKRFLNRLLLNSFSSFFYTYFLTFIYRKRTTKTDHICISVSSQNYRLNSRSNLPVVATGLF